MFLDMPSCQDAEDSLIMLIVKILDNLLHKIFHIRPDRRLDIHPYKPLYNYPYMLPRIHLCK